MLASSCRPLGVMESNTWSVAEMCGIVGLFLKDKALEPQLGALLTDMLITMTDRGHGQRRHRDLWRACGRHLQADRAIGKPGRRLCQPGERPPAAGWWTGLR